MPKSKRARVVHLTQTKSRGRERKADLIETVQKCCTDFKCIYVFACDNMRSTPLKKLRVLFKDTSRFMYGKNKVMQLAMGKSKEEAFLPGLELLADKLHGEVGLLFTNEAPSAVEASIAEFREVDFARAGFVADRDVEVKMGPIEDQPSSMYEPLRKLALPVKLNKGVVELETDHFVCRKGDALSPEQAQALKVFGVPLAEFSVTLQYRWRKGHLTELVAPPAVEKDTSAPKAGSKKKKKTKKKKTDDDEEDDAMLSEDDF